MALVVMGLLRGYTTVIHGVIFPKRFGRPTKRCNGAIMHQPSCARPEQSMTMDVDIVQADDTDAQAILSLQKLAFRTEAERYGDWSIPPLRKTLEDMQSEFHYKTFLKALFGDTIVGSVRAELKESTCAVGGLIVHPDFRRRGIATRLMLAIETMFPSAERFELFTGQKSKGNIMLYSRLGYRICHKEPLSPKVVMVFMEKMRA